VTEATLTCANHPTTPTQLRCNRCGKPICSKCAVRTPVGYRCRECVREQQQVFETASTIDYVITFGISVVAGLLALVGLNLLGALPFGAFIGLFLAPAAGGVIAEVVRRLIRGHRGRYLPTTAAIGAVIGALPFLAGGVISFLVTLRGPQGFLGGAFGLLWPAAYTFLIVSTLYWRLRGIRI
jgi:hypothetical protein